MVEMPETWGRVIGALLGGAMAWRTPGEVAGALGWDDGAATDVLAELDVAGWLAVWEVEGGPVVTLSPLGAGRLGVRLVEVGAAEVARWAKAGDPEPPRPRARHVCSRRRAAEMDFVVDPYPTPDEAWEIAERGMRMAESPRESAHPADPHSAIRIPHPALPYPTLLIGQGLTPWPGPGREPSAPCPACGERPLGHHAYCLCCDRWGLDGLLAGPGRARPPRSGAPRPGGKAAPPGQFPLAGRDAEAPPGAAPGQGEKARRKARRRRKLKARIDAEKSRRRRGAGGPPLA